MDTATFIRLAKEWQALGNAVQEQLEDVISGNFDRDDPDLNPNALRIAAKFMRFSSRELSDAENYSYELESLRDRIDA